MKITTVITTYHRPLLLKRAIRSVLNQTYSEFQICIYDNGSDRETEEVVQEFLRIDPRIKYHRHPENIGMMANYKYAFDRIETQFFSFLSDDDYLLPCFYETALNNFMKHPDAAFSACGILQLYENGNFAGDPLSLWQFDGYYLPGDGLIEMLKTRQRFPIPVGILFRKEVIKEISPNYSEDVDFFWDPEFLMRIAGRFPIVIAKKHCGVYSAHSGSYSSSFYQQMLENPSELDKYFKAVRIVLKGIDDISSLPRQLRNHASNLFCAYVSSDIILFFKYCLNNCQFVKAHCFVFNYYRNMGFSWSFLCSHLISFFDGFVLVLAGLLKSGIRRFCNCFPFFGDKVFCFLKKARRDLKMLICKKAPHGVNIPPVKLGIQAYEYGQKLLDDER